jgi:multiple sugar transport system permease protein
LAAPALLILGVFMLLPIAWSFVLSTFDWNLLSGQARFVGLGNYAKAFADERFCGAFLHTLEYTAAYVPTLLLLALVLALAFDAALPLSGVLRTVYFMPAVTSTAIVALVWRFLLDADIGYLGIFLRRAGLFQEDLLRNPDTAMGVLVGIGVWRWAGFNAIILLAGLAAIPTDYYEAAAIDGASSLRRFASITLPLLAPSIAFVSVTNLINSFQVFDQIYVLTKGGPLFKTEVLVYYTYYRGFNLFQMGYASAMAFLLFLAIMAITLFQLRGFARAEREGSAR